MSNSVYKIIEVVGTSKTSWEDAAKTAVERAAKTLRDLRVAEVSTLERCVLELARRSEADSGTRDLAEAVARMRAPGWLADAVAAALVTDVETRLALLGEVRVDRRLDRVVDEVAGLLLGAPEGGPPVASA